MNRYKVYFKDGSTTELTAATLYDAEFLIWVRTGRPVQDIKRIVLL